MYPPAAVFAVFAAEHPVISVLSHQMALLCPNRFLMAATRHQVWRVPGSTKTVKEKWEAIHKDLQQEPHVKGLRQDEAERDRVAFRSLCSGSK